MSDTPEAWRGMHGGTSIPRPPTAVTARGTSASARLSPTPTNPPPREGDEKAHLSLRCNGSRGATERNARWDWKFGPSSQHPSSI